MERKILIAVDGSPYSTNALHYIGKLFSGVSEARFHLLCICQSGAASTAARQWLSDDELMNVVSPAVRDKLYAKKKYMQQAITQLKKYQITEEQISTEVCLSHMGVAQDIILKAKKEKFDALLVGRRGIGKLEEMFMGSVSASILQKCGNVPIWIIDGKVNSCKFLVPVDGTFHSLKAIDHLSFIISDNPCAEVTLFHSAAMLANRPAINPQDFYAMWGKEWCDKNLSRPDSLFHGPKQLLIDNGFPESKINWLQTVKGIDPSRQIMRQALIDEYGTIVMGRRGIDIDKGVFKGVSDRVLFMAEQVALWVVG